MIGAMSDFVLNVRHNDAPGVLLARAVPILGCYGERVRASCIQSIFPSQIPDAVALPPFSHLCPVEFREICHHGTEAPENSL